MGRTSKFSFPVPGRSKHTTTPTKEKDKSAVTTHMPSGLSKAQRLLGAGSDLNIDTQVRNDDDDDDDDDDDVDDDDIPRIYPSSRSSGMNVSIAESTHSIPLANDTGSYRYGSDQWDRDIGVLPKSRIRGKASSTLLGQTYGKDATTDTASLSRRMRHENSSSTLNSHYDRQNSPLSISQQTSASSARDLALRKGHPSVIAPIPRSPLLEVESSDLFEEQYGNDFDNGGDMSRERSKRKKPARLDLSILFPSRNKRNSKMTDGEALAPSSSHANASTTGTRNGPQRKLTKAQSNESLRSEQPSLRSAKPHDSKYQRHSKATLTNMYSSYEQLALSSPMSQIPESRVPDPEPVTWNGRRAEAQLCDPVRESRSAPSQSEHRVKSREPQIFPARDSRARRRADSDAQPRNLPAMDQETISLAEPFSWRNVRESIGNRPWDSSAVSISSRNTKTSRHTSTSVFSNSDLKQSSVLSLSSDSEEEMSDEELLRSPATFTNDKASKILNGESHWPVDTPRLSIKSPENPASTYSSRKGAAPAGPFLTIPETSATSSRISGPWSQPKLDNSQNGPSTRTEKDKRRSKRTQRHSKRSSNQPTPPQSPASEVRDVETDSSHFMAVTKQEEALLEAMRQKRARMREAIIEEHETHKSPPRAPDRQVSRLSHASSVSTIRGQDFPNDQHRILLYLATPLNENHLIDTAEPSPDLSDFLSFGSDEDSTPRTSWIPPRKNSPSRPDSISLLESQRKNVSPLTPPRLSAVGSSVGFRPERVSNGSLGAKKRNTNAGVRFVNDAKMVLQQDFMFEEGEEGGVVLGML